MNLTYESSSGAQFNFEGEFLKVSEGSYHEYAWDVSKRSARYGDIVVEFKREGKYIPLKMTLRGELTKRKDLLDQMSDAFETDIFNLSSGKLWFGDYYIRCFMIKSLTEPDDLPYRSVRKVTAYCPYPFWIKENENSFNNGKIIKKITNGKHLDFNNDFAYDYTSTYESIENTGFKPSNFIIRIYGVAENPRIRIGKHSYGVDVHLDRKEILEINSINKTVLKIDKNGKIINCFHLRDKTSYIFQKIPNGLSRIEGHKIKFDIVIFDERSEPKWTWEFPEIGFMPMPLV